MRIATRSKEEMADQRVGKVILILKFGKSGSFTYYQEDVDRKEAQSLNLLKILIVLCTRQTPCFVACFDAVFRSLHIIMAAHCSFAPYSLKMNGELFLKTPRTPQNPLSKQYT